MGVFVTWAVIVWNSLIPVNFSVTQISCSCYANSVLQCLAFTPPLTVYFLQGLHSKACEWHSFPTVQILWIFLLCSCFLVTFLNVWFPISSLCFCKISGKAEEWCFTCELELLVKKAKEGNTPLSPVGIMSRMESIGRHLANGREEDAHEFLRWVGIYILAISLNECKIWGSTFLELHLCEFVSNLQKCNRNHAISLPEGNWS